MNVVKDNVDCFPNLRTEYNEKNEYIWHSGCQCGKCDSKKELGTYQEAMSIWQEHKKQKLGK